MAKSYVEFEVPKELAERMYDALEVVAESGKIGKGTNEATKCIERGLAKIVIIAEDVDPEEIVMHLPALCKEKQVPFVFVPSKQELGAACGMEVATASACVTEEGTAKKQIKELIEEIERLKTGSKKEIPKEELKKEEKAEEKPAEIKKEKKPLEKGSSKKKEKPAESKEEEKPLKKVPSKKEEKEK